MVTDENISDDEDKKQQINLDEFIGKKEVAKAGIHYPNLYSQVHSSLSKLEREERGILEEIKDLYFEQGDFIVDEIIKSIPSGFIDEFMEGDGNLGDADEEISITRKDLFKFSSDISTKVDAAIHLKSIFDRLQNAKEIKSRIRLAKKGILL